MRPALTLAVPPDDAVHLEPADDLPLTVPVDRAGTTPWPTQGTTTWVPAALLLAAAGRCSCDDCCADLARSRARRQLAAV